MSITTTTQSTKTIPTLKKPPIIGNLVEFQRDRLNMLMRVWQECGDIGRFDIGQNSFIQINSPALVQQILVKDSFNFMKGELIRKAFCPYIGDGLFTVEGETAHRNQRKIIAHSFQPQQIKYFSTCMSAYSEQLQERWSEGEVIDLNYAMIELTMNIIGKTVFDVDDFSKKDELATAMEDIFKYVNDLLTSIFTPPLNWPTPRNKRTRAAMATLKRRINEMIHERLNQPTVGQDILSSLIQARTEDGEKLSEQKIHDEAASLFSAGHETTAAALIWVWYLLVTHPDAYQKVQHEVDNALQGRTPTYTDLQHLPYCEQVIKETLRLYPPSYVTPRVPAQDMELDGYAISKKDTLLIVPYTIQRRPDYFKDPEQFRPERFTPEFEKQLPRNAYFPFGAGPRVCIGNHFALMEMQLVLATIAQRVTFQMLPVQHAIPDVQKSVVIRSKEVLTMAVHRR